jgi:hypothetical protein
MIIRESSLSASEKLTLHIGRAVFSRKAFRTFIFFYALALHLLVAVTLWTHTVSSHCPTTNDL